MKTKKEGFKVVMSSGGNIDHGENPYKAVSPTSIRKVISFEKASELCKKYIAKFNLGAGNWTGGQIYKNNKKVAMISYNGRIWPV